METAILARTRRRRGIETRALVAALALGLLAAGCALVVPPAWRSRAPIPLAGPLEVPSDLPAASDPTHDEALAAAIATDRLRLVEIVSDPARVIIGGPGEEELREIASRLPRLQNKLDARPGAESGSRIRHPVIR